MKCWVACRTSLIASINGKCIQRTCWHLGTSSKNPSPLLLWLVLPILPFMCLQSIPNSQPIYLTQLDSIMRQLPAAGCYPVPSLPTKRCLCCCSPLSAERGMDKYVYLPISLQEQQICKFFSSLATQGCQFDKSIAHSRSRKPTDAVLCFNSWCLTPQWGNPLATAPRDNSTTQCQRACAGVIKLWWCYSHAAPPELRLTNVLLISAHVNRWAIFILSFRHQFSTAFRGL